MHGDDHRQVPFVVEQRAMAALGPDLDEPGPLQRPDDLTTRDGGELGHAGRRTSTDASSGLASTSGTGLSSKDSSSASRRLARACSWVSPWLATSTARRRAT
jgi:hypothetical protein